MTTPRLTLLSPDADETEVVERKGMGHPDTICDGVAEAASRALCRAYLHRFGTVLHHNLDKALLVGGAARPAFAGGEVIQPMVLYLAGRAADGIGDVRVPVREIVIGAARSWLREHLHAVDVERHIRIEALVRPGSADLVELFMRNAASGTHLANDTSCGVGYAPLSATEKLVLDTTARLENMAHSAAAPEFGEDVKVMAVRSGGRLEVTVACAMIGRYLRDIDHYMARREAVADVVRAAVGAAGGGFEHVAIAVNAADVASAGSVYLTVTGTSAESGDDGEVGRGNRVNGLITASRPMTLEAAAGKNPMSHVGKLYNVAAHAIARTVVAEIHEVAHAECVLVSRIGRRVDDPASVDVRVRLGPNVALADVAKRIQDLVRDGVKNIPALSTKIISGAVTVF